MNHLEYTTKLAELDKKIATLKEAKTILTKEYNKEHGIRGRPKKIEE